MMKSKKLTQFILTALFNEANRLPFEEPKYATHELWEMCKQIQDNLQVLEIFKNNLKIEINDNPLYDGSYLVYLENDENHYICISITEEEKNILKDWLEK